MQRLTIPILLAALITPSMASAQFIGFSFGYRGYYPGPRVYGTVVYPGPAYVYPGYYVANPAPYAVEGPSATGQARITILFSDEHADLIVQGQLIHSAGKTRTFSSQQLQAGKTYSYMITMRGLMNGVPTEETRKVEFQAGSLITVDFTKAYVETLPAPATIPNSLPTLATPPPPK